MARRSLSILLAAIGVVASLVVAAPAEAAPAVKVSKIYFDSPGSDTRSNSSLNAEYVVIKNVSTTTRHITGWTIRDNTGYTYKFGTTRLAPGAAVTLHTGKGTNTAAHRYWQRTNYVWNNTYDTATLKNGAGTVLHRCSYPESLTGAVKYC